VLWCAEALAQHGDQGLFGEGECGLVPVGRPAGGGPPQRMQSSASCWAWYGMASTLIIWFQSLASRPVRAGCAQSGRSGSRGRRAGRGRRCRGLGAQGVVRVAVPVVAVQRQGGHPLVADLGPQPYCEIPSAKTKSALPRNTRRSPRRASSVSAAGSFGPGWPGGGRSQSDGAAGGLQPGDQAAGSAVRADAGGDVVFAELIAGCAGGHDGPDAHQQRPR
jgi:hypothetical protein